VNIANIADVAGRKDTQDPLLGSPENQPKNLPNQSLALWATQNNFLQSIHEVKFSEGGEQFYFLLVRGKSHLGGPALDGLVPVTFDRLEEAFPRDRFLALDVETTGLSAACDGVRTVQFADGESAAMVVFDRPVPARALVVLADFLRGRRVVAHNARFEASWLRQAEIDLVLDDTVLLFSAVRGTRSPKGDRTAAAVGSRCPLRWLPWSSVRRFDKSEQVSDWAAPTLVSASQLTYALNDAIVTHRIWEGAACRAYIASASSTASIVASWARICASPAAKRTAWRRRHGFDVAAHQAWIARKGSR
jgi:hypothetical protein